LIQLEIVDASIQTVSGRNYKLKLNIQHTSCSESSGSQPASCNTDDETCVGVVHAPLDTSSPYTVYGGPFSCKARSYVQHKNVGSRNPAERLLNSKMATLGLVSFVLSGLYLRN